MTRSYAQFLSEMSAATADGVQRQINDLIRGTPYEVRFSRHFYDRLAGRDASVTGDELYNSFRKFFAKYHDALERMEGKDVEAILKDYAAQLNIVLDIDETKKAHEGRYTIEGITIMRKNPRNFVPSVGGEKQFPVY